MTILEMAEALRTKKVSSLELTNDTLQKIKDSRLNAFITVIEDAARARASAMDAELSHGIDRGPMHGVPISHKDLVYTKGVRTTGGSKIFKDFVPDHDADIAISLERAGSVLVGKTNLHEFAYGITSTNPHFGAVRNPWDPERIPGGSSGGSGAAVAAGILPFATGTDTGGSIRIPASFCGVTGLKPTFGLISKRGVMPLGWTMDHMGPITKTVRDCAVAFHAMGGPAVDLKSTAIRGLRIGLPTNYYFDKLDLDVSESVRTAVQTAAALGARIIDIKVPDIDALNVVGRMLLLAEATSVHRENLLTRRADIGADVVTLLDQGRLIRGSDYVDAQRLRRIYCREFSKLWSEVDCIFTPTTPTAAPKIGQMTMKVGSVDEDVRLATTRLMRAINILGIPALSIPCGFTKAGLPIGLQILGAPRAEEMILRVGAAIEDATGVVGRKPGA
ncbi:MAG TPA: amidase [Bryobacteraceae bacterium]|jgi:aspartyl-tRNA(Asn)/glutamyl-tRNA(Gln) amidotransferase subunit A|nr:amidase [Bryobacteraceae bacterium]